MTILLGLGWGGWNRLVWERDHVEHHLAPDSSAIGRLDPNWWIKYPVVWWLKTVAELNIQHAGFPHHNRAPPCNNPIDLFLLLTKS